MIIKINGYHKLIKILKKIAGGTLKKLTFVLLLLVLFISCEDNVNVYLEKEPGSLYGQVLPLGINATVELYQSELITQTNPDVNGYFTFTDIEAGSYLIKVKAENFGTSSQIMAKVESDENNYVGTIQLSEFPNPLSRIYFPGGDQMLSGGTVGTIMTLTFMKDMDTQSLIDAISFVPAIENLSISTNSNRIPANPPINSNQFYISGKLQLNTQYSFTINSTAKAIDGQALEFDYSSTFQTEPFAVETINFNNQYDDQKYLYIQLNSSFNTTDFLNNFEVSPQADVRIISQSENRLYVEPIFSWRPATTYQFTLKGTMPDIYGNLLAKDTTISMDVAPLQVHETYPYNNEHFVEPNGLIVVYMNNLLDVSTLQNAIQFTPAVNFTLETNIYHHATRFAIYPDSLMSNTEYTITLDTSLKDYYGGNMPENYAFSFVTQ